MEEASTDKALTEDADEVVGLARRLIAIPSVSGDADGQRAVQRAVAEYATERHPAVREDGDLGAERPWTLLSTGDARAGTLLFVCHADTVPAGDPGAWSTDPFRAVVDGGRLTGRGAVDMKCGLAAATSALVLAAERGAAVAVLMTSDEEAGALGAAGAAAALADRDVGAVIVPEATDGVIHVGHRGALWLDVEARGRAAHGSTPGRGENAILGLARVLERARHELPLSSDPDLGEETWNVGTVAGGTAPNIVPAHASATIDMRTAGAGEAQVRWWRAQPELASVRTLLSLPALRTDRTHPWIRSLPASVAPAGVPYFTDASVLRAHLPGVPVVVWGPGAPAQMHAVDEAMDLGSLRAMCGRYRRAVLDRLPESRGGSACGGSA
ncbi:succinyl-diaminopimelate desuccinylase [Streptomyces sp. Amel2xB2]|uniref:M20 family metallopeptidase n=1 Tax=Streptomyces sp. Amel2xB2 TaxID=1305829 RepID=UPI000DB9E6D1|nr:M20/M25/M40 family metallo-hydrolase [Streptomyces sp. Amel2xB2]RAJ71232.1 succinyl-diaminopimelate desuccinylase [Streptomyces sp. Amel2xB2]